MINPRTRHHTTTRGPIPRSARSRHKADDRNFAAGAGPIGVSAGAGCADISLDGEHYDQASTHPSARPCHNRHSQLPTPPRAATLPADDLDMNLVARIVQQAGVRCLHETPDDSTTAILAEPRLRNGQTHWTVRATRIRAHDRDHVCVGPNNDRRMAMRILGPDERHLAALIVAQALRVDPEETLTFDEVETLGLR
jgi:hypothetical protein